MSHGYTPTRTKVLNQLIDAGSWLQREQLAPITTCVPALDDALADLVEAGQVEFRVNVGYRLAGSVAVRRAAWLQRHRKTKKAVFAQPDTADGQLHVGVAEEIEGVGNVFFEICMPLPEPGPDYLAQHLVQVDQVLAFANRKTGATDGGTNLRDRSAEETGAGAASAA